MPAWGEVRRSAAFLVREPHRLAFLYHWFHGGLDGGDTRPGFRSNSTPDLDLTTLCYSFLRWTLEVRTALCPRAAVRSEGSKYIKCFLGLSLALSEYH